MFSCLYRINFTAHWNELETMAEKSKRESKIEEKLTGKENLKNEWGKNV